MSSVTATHLIMFIGSLVIASAVAGTVIVQVDNVGSSIENRGSTVAEDLETDIAIISDETQSDAIVNQTADPTTVTVLVKNIGSRDLTAHPSVVDALVDGSYDTVESVERVDADGTTWEPGGVVRVTILTTDHDVSGDVDIAVIVNGNEDSINIHV